MAFDIQEEYTLPEILRANARDGSYMPFIDTLKKHLPLIEEGYWMEANGDMVHEYSRTVTEPVGELVRMGEGSGYEAATTVPVKTDMARMESNLRLDTRALKKSSDPVRYRKEREALHVRGMMKSFEKMMFDPVAATGDHDADPRSCDGLWKLYNALSAGSVVSNGASGGLSIWIVKHGPDGMFFLHPKDAGTTIELIDHKVQKHQSVRDGKDKVMYNVETGFSFQFGMGVGNLANVKRLCNIAVSGNNSFYEDGTKPSKGEEALIDLLEEFDDLDGLVIYTGKVGVAQMRKRLMNRANINFTEETIWGRTMLAFNGIPVIKLPSLVSNEPAVA